MVAVRIIRIRRVEECYFGVSACLLYYSSNMGTLSSGRATGRYIGFPVGGVSGRVTVFSVYVTSLVHGGHFVSVEDRYCTSVARGGPNTSGSVIYIGLWCFRLGSPVHGRGSTCGFFLGFGQSSPNGVAIVPSANLLLLDSLAWPVVFSSCMLPGVVSKSVTVVGWPAFVLSFSSLWGHPA